MSTKTKTVNLCKEVKKTVDGEEVYYFTEVNGLFMADSFSSSYRLACKWYEDYVKGLDMKPVKTILESVTKEVGDD